MTPAGHGGCAMVSCVSPYSADGVRSLIRNAFIYYRIIFTVKNDHYPVIFLRYSLLSERDEQVVGRTHGSCDTAVRATPLLLWKWSMKTQVYYSNCIWWISLYYQKYFPIKNYYNYYLRGEFFSRSFSLFVKFLHNWTLPIKFLGCRIKDRSALYREMSHR